MLCYAWGLPVLVYFQFARFAKLKLVASPQTGWPEQQVVDQRLQQKQQAGVWGQPCGSGGVPGAGAAGAPSPKAAAGIFIHSVTDLHM